MDVERNQQVANRGNQQSQPHNPAVAVFVGECAKHGGKQAGAAAGADKLPQSDGGNAQSGGDDG